VIVVAAAIALPRVGDPVLMLSVTRQVARDLSGRLFDRKTLVVGRTGRRWFAIMPTDDRARGAFITMGVVPARCCNRHGLLSPNFVPPEEG
jgi:hypothetical protein